jgi:hypothetical protein
MFSTLLRTLFTTVAFMASHEKYASATSIGREKKNMLWALSFFISVHTTLRHCLVLRHIRHAWFSSIIPEREKSSPPQSDEYSSSLKGQHVRVMPLRLLVSASLHQRHADYQHTYPNRLDALQTLTQ